MELLLLLNTLCCIQESSLSKNIDSQNIKPTSYEYNLYVLDRITGGQLASTEDLVIVISRLGKGENPVYNARRLYTVKTYLKENLHFPESNIIIATGESTNSYGILEIYIKGKKYDTLAAEKNQELWITEIHNPKSRYYLPTPKNTRNKN